MKKNYIKEYVRKTKTKYGKTFKGVQTTTLSYPILFKAFEREQINTVEDFFRRKYGMSLLDRIVWKLIKKKETDDGDVPI